MSDLKVSVPEQNVYTTSVSSAPLYRFRTIQPVVQFNASNTNTQSLLFDCPLNVFNFSKSYLSFDLVILDNDATKIADNLYLKIASGAINPIRSILLKGSNSSYDFCNIQNVQAYSRIIPYELSDQEFDDLHEEGARANAGVLYSNGFGWSGLEHAREALAVTFAASNAPGNTAANINTAIDTVAASATATYSGTYKSRLLNCQLSEAAAIVQPSVKSVPGERVINRIMYQEAKTAHNAAGAITIRYRIPLWLFKSTILSLNRDIHTAGEKLQLEFVMAPLSEYVATNDEQLTITNIAALTATQQEKVSISSPIMRFAIQENQSIAQQVEQLVRSVGIHIPFPYLTQTRYTTTNATTFSYTQNLRGDQGGFIHAIYNLICPQADSVMSRSNVYNVADAQWSNRRSSLNTAFLQDTAVDTYSEWMALKNNKHNGVLRSYPEFQENAVVVDRFDSGKVDVNSLTGLPLLPGKSMDYTIDYTKAAAIHTYYNMPVYIRQLHLTPLGVSVTA